MVFECRLSFDGQWFIRKIMDIRTKIRSLFYLYRLLRGYYTTHTYYVFYFLQDITINVKTYVLKLKSKKTVFLLHIYWKNANIYRKFIRLIKI